MGFLRKTVLVFISAILFILLVSGLFFLVISSSLEYENVKKPVTDIFKSLIYQDEGFQGLNENYNNSVLYCNQNPTFIFINQTRLFLIRVPCSEILKGMDPAVNYVSEDILQQIYYTNYTCSSFSKCIKESSEKSGGFPTYFVSNQFRIFCNNLSFMLFGVCVLSVIFLFFLIEKKPNFMTLLGIFLILSSLFFIGIKSITYALISSFNFPASISGVGNIFFFCSADIFLIFIVSGIILAGLGVWFRASGIWCSNDTGEIA